MDEFDDIDAEVEAGTIEYWKKRSRQWQSRCQRSEREKTELIHEIELLKLAAEGPKSARADRRRAVMIGDSSGATSGAPRGIGRARG